MASSRFSISRVLMCLSSKLPSTCRRWVRWGTTQRGPHCFYDLAPWSSKCGTRTSSISITSDLLEMPVLGPYPRPTEIRNARGGAQQSVFTSPSGDCDVHGSLGTAALDHSSSVPKRRQGWEPTEGGTQVPTYSLTAGANTMQSLVGLRPEEWVGRDGCRR